MNGIKILIGCEESQTVTIQFRELGFEAYSCDLLDCSGGHPEWHLKMDIFEAIKLKKWDFIGIHPVCTKMTLSGNRHYSFGKPKYSERLESVEWTINLFKTACDNSNFVYMENPMGCMNTDVRLNKPQIIQPYFFGDEIQKTTCLWLHNLPELHHSKENHVGKGEFVTFPSGKKMPKWYANTPSTNSEKNRQIRSKTFPGIAKAMAEQWGEYLLKNNNNTKPIIMAQKKLPRGFSVSEETLSVTIEGIEYNSANLLKSMIPNQKIVLLNVNDVLHEIEVENLGLENSDLKKFKNFVEQYKLKLSDLGIESAKPVVNYDLKQEDFEQLQAEFPVHDYIKIAILDKYLKENSKSGMYEMRQVLKMLTEKQVTVKDYITNCQEQKEQIINNEKSEIVDFKPAVEPAIESTQEPLEDTPDRTDERLELLRGMGLKFQIGTGCVGYGFQVSMNCIENDSIEEWEEMVSKIAAAAAGTMPLEVAPDGKHLVIPVETKKDAITQKDMTLVSVEITDSGYDMKPLSNTIGVIIPEPSEPQQPVKKPVSLQVIGGLTADRITELQGLEANQNKIVTDNPFTAITDKKTLDKAKKYEAALLKASTAIDGDKGILKNFVTHANQFIKMGKDFLNPLAKITRDAYDKQKAERIRYENAEAIRIQQEQAAELQKINTRTARLFAIPMVFNGELYMIGTLCILPSQIESATDEEFEALVNKGIAIKTALDGAETETQKENRELKEKLAALMLLNGMSNLPDAPAAPEPVNGNPVPASPTAPAPSYTSGVPAVPTSSVSCPPVATAPAMPNPNSRIIGRHNPGTEYIIPNPLNTVLSRFDMDHISFISAEPISPAFIKCRSYFIEGTKQTALDIQKILNDPDPTIKKSVKIVELCELLLNAKN